MLLNFNDKKRRLINLITCINSKKKYKFNKKLNAKKHEKLLLDDKSGISSNTKAIKYIRRNEQNNSIIFTQKRNNLGLIDNNNRISFLKENSLKRNKSNNYYLIKNNKLINNIISPPNHLPYSKLLFTRNN